MNRVVISLYKLRGFPPTAALMKMHYLCNFLLVKCDEMSKGVEQKYIIEICMWMVTFHLLNEEETYQDPRKQVIAFVRSLLGVSWLFLQNMQQAALLMIIWAITRANPEITPRPKAGVLCSVHVPSSESCKVKKKVKLKLYPHRQQSWWVGKINIYICIYFWTWGFIFLYGRKK